MENFIKPKPETSELLFQFNQYVNLLKKSGIENRGDLFNGWLLDQLATVKMEVEELKHLVRQTLPATDLEKEAC